MRFFGKSRPVAISAVKLPPALSRSQRGSFSRPMSSLSGAWVQASAISTLSVGLSFSIAFAPSTKAESSPLLRAIIIENEVSGTVRGSSALTRAKTCESVITSAGGSLSAASIPGSWSAVQVSAMPLLSRMSRITCTCGSIRRPLGAWISCGATSTTASPGLNRSPVSVGLSKSVGAFLTIAESSAAR